MIRKSLLCGYSIQAKTAREREREKFSIDGSGFLFSLRRICKLEARWWVGSWRVVKTEMPERRKDRISSALLEM